MVLRQYLYFCTSKASKLSTLHSLGARLPECQDSSLEWPPKQAHGMLLRLYLYFCTNKASNLSVL